MENWPQKGVLIPYAQTYFAGSFPRFAIEYGPSPDFQQLTFVKVWNQFPSIPVNDQEIGEIYAGVQGLKFFLWLRTDIAYNTPFTTPQNQTPAQSFISYHMQLEPIHISLFRIHTFGFPTREMYQEHDMLGNRLEFQLFPEKQMYISCFIQIIIASIQSVYQAFIQNPVLSGGYNLVRFRFTSPSLQWIDPEGENNIEFFTRFFPLEVENHQVNLDGVLAYIEERSEEYHFPGLLQTFENLVQWNVETLLEIRGENAPDYAYEQDEVDPMEQENIPFPNQQLRIPRRRAVNLPLQVQTRNQRRQNQLQQLPVSAFTRANTAARGYRIGWKMNKTNSQHYFKDPKYYFFQESGTLLDIPETEEKLCFAMAFLKSQLRIHELNEEGVIVNVVEGKHQKLCKTYANQKYAYHFPCLHVEYERKKTEFFNGTEAFIGNCYIPETIDANYLRIWIQVAQKLHAHVESVLERPVNHRDLYECCQSYGNAFGITIHIYKYEMRSTRLFTFPHEKYGNETFITHMHLFLEEEHLYSICNIRKFMVHSKCKSNVSLHNFCDYCTRCVVDGENKKKGLMHLNTCLQESPKDHALKKVCKIQPRRKFQFDQKLKMYRCLICHTGLVKSMLEQHCCMITCPTIKPALENALLWIFDVEVYQVLENGLYAHRPNLICLKRMYSAEKYEFTEMDLFCDFLFQSPLLFDNATFITHNGGSYDYMFLLIYLEKKGFSHQILHRGESRTKMLSMTVHSTYTTTFLDFYCMIPGSLRSIAESFQCELSKGRFPYLFPDPEYEGCIPALDSPEDWFGIKQCRSTQEIQEIEEWYREQCDTYCSCRDDCTCTKQKWKYQEQLRLYCWLDVEVLAKICALYREMLLTPKPSDSSWEFRGIDPFQHITASQIGFSVFLQGFDEMPLIASIQVNRQRRTSSHGLFWIQCMEKTMIDMPHVVYSQHLLNHINCPYIPEFQCCVDAFYIIVEFNIEYRLYLVYAEDNDEELLEKLKDVQYPHIVYISNQYQLKMETVQDHIPKPIIEIPEFFYGGRCEVFQLQQEGVVEEIKYIDVCSLYPYVCSFKTLPTGHPEIISWEQIDRARLNPYHPDAYFGYVKCLVKPNPSDLLGLLPQKDAVGRLVFSLETKVGTWFTAEIYLAMEQGYEILEIYQIHHFGPDKRSDVLFREYVSYWLTIKQQSEGWKKLGLREDASREEKQVFAENLFVQNGEIGKIEIDKVQFNPVMRAIAKLMLNSLWGKFVQKPRSKFSCLLTGPAQMMQLMEDPNIVQDSLVFREIVNDTLRVYGTKQSHLVDNAARYNIYLGAAVTAHARTYLHRKMLEIGARNILYCDTDSLLFVNRNNLQFQDKGLGKWVDEYPGQRIQLYQAVAPKSYSLHFQDKKPLLKAKGNTLTLPNQQKLTQDKIQQLILHEISSISLDCFQILRNTYSKVYDFALPMSRYNCKELRLQISKRQIAPDGKTFPFGYLFRRENSTTELERES